MFTVFTLSCHIHQCFLSFLCEKNNGSVHFNIMDELLVLHNITILIICGALLFLSFGARLLIFLVFTGFYHYIRTVTVWAKGCLVSA